MLFVCYPLETPRIIPSAPRHPPRAGDLQKYLQKPE
jgi:hypothetical protein